MRKIRLGKDILIRWSVTYNGSIVDPSTHDLTLELKDYYGSLCTIGELNLNNGALETTFFGKDQTKIGNYRLTLWLNKGKVGQSVVDACDAFTLVACSCDEDGDNSDTLATETTQIEASSIDVGGGVSISELAKLKRQLDLEILNRRKMDAFIAEYLGIKLPQEEYEEEDENVTEPTTRDDILLLPNDTQVEDEILIVNTIIEGDTLIL